MSKSVQSIDVFHAIEQVKPSILEQRARVVVLYTDAHRKLSLAHDGFEFAMSQADFIFAGDKSQGMPFVSQKDFLDQLASITVPSGIKFAVLAGPEKEARAFARKLETQHKGFSNLISIQFKAGYEGNELITGSVIEAINAADADIILVSSSLRHQEIWIANYRHRLNCSLILGLH